MMPPSTAILGVPVSIVDLDSAVATILDWVAQGSAQYVCVRDVHGVMLARHDPAYRDIHAHAGMVTPDGMPLVWIARARGHRIARVCGADLMEALCAASVATGASHYFYGGKPGVADRLAAKLAARFPGLAIAGTASPPFRPLTQAEDDGATAAIADAKPAIVWVGLGTPAQERWMRDHVGRIPGATLIGVGAAFDFLTGDVRRAPGWMQRSGLEWLHRLLNEPRRLWRRYLILAPRFVAAVVMEALRGARRGK